MAKTKGFDIEKYFSFNGEKISARTELYEYDDIFYLGVAYRRAATEAYPFCKGSRPYQATRRNKHDRPARPDRKTNEWFSRCVDCWNSLPDWKKQENKCSGKLAKERYWEEKKATGVKCSYFDVFQRWCLWYWNQYNRCPPFCCDLEPNPAYAGLCCGQSGFVEFTRPDGKKYRHPISCGGVPGKYTIYVYDPDGYKACIYLTCVGPKPGKTWYPYGGGTIYTTELCPPPHSYTSFLEPKNNFDEPKWFRIQGVNGPGANINMPDQYFVTGPGQCIGPVSWTWLGHWEGGHAVIYLCDGTVIDAVDHLQRNIWYADIDPDECK